MLLSSRGKRSRDRRPPRLSPSCSICTVTSADGVEREVDLRASRRAPSPFGVSVAVLSVSPVERPVDRERRLAQFAVRPSFADGASTFNVVVPSASPGAAYGNVLRPRALELRA
mgnify:CR=1 FL=1